MNNTQRTLLAVYLPLTLLVLLFYNLYPGAVVVQYLKYTIMVTLFLSTLMVQKKHAEQKIMARAYFFVIIADFFLVFFTTLNLKMNMAPLGIAGFLLAYLYLIAAYQKNCKFSRAEILTAIPITIMYTVAFLILKSYVKGLLLVGTLVFGVILCYMLWAAICTPFRNYYARKVSWVIMFSAILMFVCDSGVAVAMFHPQYSNTFVPWLENIIWAAYIPGWTLLAVVINEENLFYNKVNEDEQLEYSLLEPHIG